MPTVPKVTLYVKDSDGPIWDRAKQFAGEGGLSSFVTDAIADYLPRRERSLDEVVIEGRTAESALEQQFRFVGTKVASRAAYRRGSSIMIFGGRGGSSEPPREQIGTLDVYVTKGRSIVVHANVPKPKNMVTTHKTFRDFEKEFGQKFKDDLETIANAVQHSKFVEIE